MRKNRKKYHTRLRRLVCGVTLVAAAALLLGGCAGSPEQSGSTLGSSVPPVIGSAPESTAATSPAPTTGTAESTVAGTEAPEQTAPTEPATQPTQPTTQSTQPATQPTQATTKPTQPATQPTQATTKPTQATTKPTQATTKPTQTTTQPPTEAPTRPPVAKDAPLADLVIVTNAANKALANTLASNIQSKYHVSLPVVDIGEFTGNGAIYLGIGSFNSYGGYRYGISVDKDEVSIYLNGSGSALKAAVNRLVNEGLNSPEDKFPYALGETVIGYQWSQSDDRLTDLGMMLTSHQQSALAQGVTLHTLGYDIPEIGVRYFYAVTVEAGSAAKMMAVAAPWDATNSTSNPVSLSAVSEYANTLKTQGYNVLAITNGGFFQKSAGSNLPWGVQIIDGNVLQAPNTSNTNYTDNWFGMTYDGRYVISNTQGYSTYRGNIQYAVGGGRLLLKNGAPAFSATDPAYSTCVGLNQSGDLVLMCMDEANYAMVVRAFMELDMDIYTVLNLDGGGSTTLYAQNESGTLRRKLCGNGFFERPVADAIAIILPE